jgi:flagellar hook protein FlgE
MFSAVSGLKGHQTMLDVIGNNIANVNTAGFKASRVLFSDMYYQTLSAASAPTPATGGTNPTQIGYGSKVASIDLLNTRSGFQQTARAMDTYISGEGFFTVQDSSGELNYSRVGSFSFDASGNLLDASGSFVMGQIPTLTNPVGTLVPINIPNFQNYSGVSIGPDGAITGTNLTTMAIQTPGQIPIAVFNNPDGLEQRGDQYFGETLNSGAPGYAAAGTGLAGQLVSGGLEMSNVDLSKEFTDMIVAQRGYQANARVITTSDQVLEELVNLKR